MKRKVLKDWVVMVLGFINLICLIIFASDFKDITIFCWTHIITFGIFVFNATLITIYGKNKLFK